MYVCCDCGNILSVDRDLDDEVKYRRVISEHQRFFCTRTLSNDGVPLRTDGAYSTSK